MPHIKIIIKPELRQKCPQLQLGCLSAQVQVAPSSPALLHEIDQACSRISRTLELEDISSFPHIHSTREAYKATGKKPGRYRPSAEALLRRVVSGKGLYQINNVVDVINLCSIISQYSIGGYDASQIIGQVTMGIGQKGEPYEAIARGALNIAGLPVLRDEQGAFGSPTSDSTRTMARKQTRELLLVFFNFGRHDGLVETLRAAVALFETHCNGQKTETWL